MLAHTRADELFDVQVCSRAWRLNLRAVYVAG